MLLNEIFSEKTKLAVWNKGRIISEYDSKVYRQDLAGAWMKYDEYGKTSRELNFGWEIDHIKPQAKGGSNNLDNLQPLQWSNNRSKGDNYPDFSTSIASSGTRNIKENKKHSRKK